MGIPPLTSGGSNLETQAMMQNGMMGSGMMWGMGLVSLLIDKLQVIAIAALGKYLFRI